MTQMLPSVERPLPSPLYPGTGVPLMNSVGSQLPTSRQDQTPGWPLLAHHVISAALQNLVTTGA